MFFEESIELSGEAEDERSDADLCLFVDDSGECVEVVGELVVGWQHLFFESFLNIVTFFVTGTDYLSYLLIKR